MIAAAVYNAAPGKRKKTAKAADFLLKEKAEVSAEKLRAGVNFLRAVALPRSAKRRRKKRAKPDGRD